MAGGANLEDHYGVLGVGKHASADEVKRAYRQLSKVYHPDKAGHLEEVERRNRERQMVSLNVAYQVLMSPRQRQEYDMIRSPRGAAAAATERRRPASANSASRGRASWKPPQAPMPSRGANAAPSQGAGVYVAAAAGARMSRPRYQVGSKYTQSSRQARRMDPSQYTVHVDGRAAEFERAASTPQGHAPEFERASSTPRGLGSPGRFAAPPPGQPRNPIWLQRTLDIARDWEQAHCPDREQEERYVWKNACGGLLQGLRERRQNRAAEAGHSDEEKSQPVAAAT